MSEMLVRCPECPDPLSPPIALSLFSSRVRASLAAFSEG